MFQSQEDVSGFPETITNDSCHCSPVNPLLLTQYSTAVPAVPLVPPERDTAYASAAIVGHLGHRKTWYHSQAERQGSLRLNMVVGIRAHGMTSRGWIMLKNLQQWKMWQTIRQHRDSKTLIMGVSWYRPEQWERLREISEDKETFALPYEASLVESEKKMQDLEVQGIRPIKVEVDVEALLTWCTTQGLAVTPETRTKFMMNTLRDLVRKGIVKP
jgi:hypothetical protein